MKLISSIGLIALVATLALTPSSGAPMRNHQKLSHSPGGHHYYSSNIQKSEVNSGNVVTNNINVSNNNHRSFAPTTTFMPPMVTAELIPPQRQYGQQYVPEQRLDYGPEENGDFSESQNYNDFNDGTYNYRDSDDNDYSEDDFRNDGQIDQMVEERERNNKKQPKIITPEQEELKQRLIDLYRKATDAAWPDESQSEFDGSTATPEELQRRKYQEQLGKVLRALSPRKLAGKRVKRVLLEEVEPIRREPTEEELRLVQVQQMREKLDSALDQLPIGEEFGSEFLENLKNVDDDELSVEQRAFRTLIMCRRDPVGCGQDQSREYGPDYLEGPEDQNQGQYSNGDLEYDGEYENDRFDGPEYQEPNQQQDYYGQRGEESANSYGNRDDDVDDIDFYSGESNDGAPLESRNYESNYEPSNRHSYSEREYEDENSVNIPPSGQSRSGSDFNGSNGLLGGTRRSQPRLLPGVPNPNAKIPQKTPASVPVKLITEPAQFNDPNPKVVANHPVNAPMQRSSVLLAGNANEKQSQLLNQQRSTAQSNSMPKLSPPNVNVARPIQQQTNNNINQRINQVDQQQSKQSPANVQQKLVQQVQPRVQQQAQQSVSKLAPRAQAPNPTG